MRGGDFCTTSRAILPGDAAALLRPGVRIPRAHLARMVGRPLGEVRPLPALEAYSRPEPVKLPVAMRRAKPIENPIVVPALTDTAKRVLNRIARHHGVTLEEIVGPSRVAFFVRIRQQAYYELRALKRANGKPLYSTVKIGQMMGRDHTTVLQGIAQHAASLEAA